MASSRSESSAHGFGAGWKQSEVCHQCKVELPVDTDYVMLWLEHAQADAKEAKRSKSSTHALYWVQQSVEKLVKARLLAHGGCYCDMMDVRHESLKGFLKIIDHLLRDTSSRDLIDGLTGSNSQQELGRVQNLLGDDESRSEMAIWGPEVLDVLLGTVTRLEEERKSLLSKAIKSGAIAYQSHSQMSDWLHQIIPQRFMRRRTDVEGVMARIYSMLGICDHQLRGQEFSIDGRVIENGLRVAETEVRLYVLASATFAHATSSRYPAHPNAPADVQQAAMFRPGDGGKAKAMGGIGIQHYSNRIGVIYFVRRLAMEAEATAKSMREWLQSLDSENLEPLPPCMECENSTHLARQEEPET